MQGQQCQQCVSPKNVIVAKKKVKIIVIFFQILHVKRSIKYSFGLMDKENNFFFMFFHIFLSNDKFSPYEETLHAV